MGVQAPAPLTSLPSLGCLPPLEFEPAELSGHRGWQLRLRQREVQGALGGHGLVVGRRQPLPLLVLQPLVLSHQGLRGTREGLCSLALP